jgi:hypothetical protein
MYPLVGEDIGAVPILKKIIRNNNRLILFTMRSGKELDDAVEWFNTNNITLYGINTNPTQLSWTTSPKAYCNLYIDDSGINCPLIYDKKSHSKYVDWSTIEQLLIKMNLIK